MSVDASDASEFGGSTPIFSHTSTASQLEQRSAAKTLFEELQGGFRLIADIGDQQVPLYLVPTSVFLASNEDDMVDEDTVVLRGGAESATAVAILRGNGTASITVNMPDRPEPYMIHLPHVARETDEQNGSDLGVDASEFLLAEGSDAEAQSLPPFVPFDITATPMPLEELQSHGHEHGAIKSGDALPSQEARDSSLTADLLEGLYVAPPGGGSILYSRHSWKGDSRREPVNVVFYNYGSHSNVYSVLVDRQWRQESSSWCASDSDVFIADASHGGDNSWRVQSRHMVKFPNFDHANCAWNRYHMRLYPSSTGDTHSPGFRHYTLGPVHFESAGHGALGFIGSVNPQRGQDKLMDDLWYPNPSPYVVYPIPIRIPNAPSHCAWCQNWQGWVDFYNIGPPGTDSCQNAQEYTLFSGSTMLIRWRC